MAHPFIKITLQQRKQKMQPLPQRKITHHPQTAELSSPNKRKEIVSSCCHRNKALLRNN